MAEIDKKDMPKVYIMQEKLNKQSQKSFYRYTYGQCIYIQINKIKKKKKKKNPRFLNVLKSKWYIGTCLLLGKLKLLQFDHIQMLKKLQDNKHYE